MRGSPCRRDLERGSALLLALSAMALMLALGGALVLVTTTETRIASRFARNGETLAAAEAVLERALLDLAGLADWDLALNGTVVSTFTDGAPAGGRSIGGTTIDLGRQTHVVRCGRASCAAADIAAVTAERPWGRSNPHWQLFAWGPVSALTPVAPDRDVYVLVWVGDDPGEVDGDPLHDGTAPHDPGRGTVSLLAHGYAAGGLRRILEVTLTRRAPVPLPRNGNPLTPPAPPAVGPMRVVAWREVR